ncbi:MAG: hypothetical protein AB1505_20270 [Candidatus Latescibacterota bacterium]
MQSYYLPVHMTDLTRQVEFSHISIRQEGTPLAAGRMRMSRAGCSFELPRRAAQVCRRTARVYEEGFRAFASAHGSHPVLRPILRDVTAYRGAIAVTFMDRNDRVARLYRPAGRAAPHLLLDATWAPQEVEPAAAHVAGIVLLGTLSMLNEKTTQRAVMHRVFDLYGLLSAAQKQAVQRFLRASSLDAGNVFANAFANLYDRPLALAQEGLDIEELTHVPTEVLFHAGHALDRARFSRRGAGLRQEVARLLDLTCPGCALGRPEPGESAEDHAGRVLAHIERTLKWRDKWATWMRMQDRVDFPYPQDHIFDLLNQEYEDLDTWRASINTTISRYFDYRTEGENILRISAWAYENGIRLVSGRLSRAFGNQANLLSTARYVVDKETLAPLARRLERASRSYPTLHTAATRLTHLVQEQKRTPYARLVGALNAFDEALAKHHSQAAARILDEADSASRQLLARGAVEQARQRLGQQSALADGLFAVSARFRRQLDACQKQAAAYVLQLQRLHPGEAMNLANANAFREVHSGKEEDLRDLLRQGGDYIYSTPGLGRIPVDGREEDIHWITKVNDWVEAIPLFIKERVIQRQVQVGAETVDVEQIQTEVDQEAMEAFFRIHAEYWVRNLDEVLASERVDLARTLLVESDRRLAAQVAARMEADPALPRDEAVRQVIKAAPRLHPQIGRLAALVAASEDALIDAVHRLVETEGLPRRQALRRVLCQTHREESANLVGRALVAATGGRRLPAAVEAVFAAQPARLQTPAEALQGIALERTRPVPSLHILTTESAGMTEGYVQSWVEEEMALYNVVRAHGLQAEVDQEMAAYRRRSFEIGRRVIGDLGMDVVVEEVVAEQHVSPQAAVGIVVASYRPVSEQVALLATLLEVGEDPQAALDTVPVRDLARVEHYLQQERARLEEEGIPVVAANNGRAFEARVEQAMAGRPGLSVEEARRVVAQGEPDYREELASLVRCQARREVFRQLASEHPELDLEARERTFLRMHSQVARSTARKRVIARHQLNALTLDPRYYYQATGPNKRYNLLYTPSRVNLGHRERDSVVKWRQWVGGADAAAAQAGFEFYSLVNEGGVEERPALAYAEIQKTAENGLTVTHFAGSNALGLLCMAVMEGDAQDMGDQMNLRGDRYVAPAGEGYGGYCVPKDGLFLAFVLSLTNDVKLRQMGVPDHLHAGIMRMARSALLRQGEFATELDWQRWAADKLLQHEGLHEHLGKRGDMLVFHITKIARALEMLGRPWHETAAGPRLIANLAADWSVERMVINAEQVNRFMVFYKAWAIYDALREARAKYPACPQDHQARIAVSAEYKPVQDVRFSTGLRLFEIFAKTGEHLHYAFDEEGQNLIHLMFEGFDPQTRDPVGRRAVRQALQACGASAADPSAQARLQEAFPGHHPPADVVVTSVTLSSTNDLLFYTSDARLDEIAGQVQVQLGDYGLTEEQIRANCLVHGGHLRRWAGLSQLPEERLQDLLGRVGGGIHALVLKLRGPGRDYEKDVQGIDVLNTGIPFPQLLELLQDPPKLVTLMRQGNPNSALVIADGCAGREPRALAEYDVQAFFAACERVGRRGTYVGIGLGRRNVERLEEEMRAWRGRGQRLLEAVLAVAQSTGRQRRSAMAAALQTYAEIQRTVTDADEAGKALRAEEKARRFRKWRSRDAYISQARVKVAAGLPLGRLDAGTWIAGLGGAFVLMGERQSRIDELLQGLAAGIAPIVAASHTTAPPEVAPFTPEEVVRIHSALVRPAYEPDAARFTQQKLVESSSKAVEVAAVEALERRRALRVRAEKAKAMADREAGFQEALRAESSPSFARCLERARQSMDELLARVRDFQPSAEDASRQRTQIHQLFGRLIACTRLGLDLLAGQLLEGEAQAEFRADVDRVYAGRQIVLEDWKRLAGGYEDIGGLARLAEAGAAAGPGILDQVVDAMELFYVTFALAQTLQFGVDDPDQIDVRVFYKSLTDFFAETINDHWHAYAPWIFDRGTAFDSPSEQERFALCVAHHEWLYRYIRLILVRCTDLRRLPDTEVDELLGRMDEEGVVPGIGAGGETEVERRWRAYNQLREVSFIHSDGFPTPPVFSDLDPSLIEADTRVNVVFVYPVGRTHVSRALREGPTLNARLKTEGRRGANLLITRHAQVHRFPGARRDQLAVTDAHLYVDRATYVAALERHRGLSPAQAEAAAQEQEGRGALTAKGIRIAVRFGRAGQPVPVPVGAMIPFHGLPVYDSGRSEDLGLPATVQSLIFSDITYDKSLYPQIYLPEFGVEMPPEMDWKQEYGEGRSAQETRQLMAQGVPGTDWGGLEAFAAEHAIVLIKGAAESGARNLKVFDLQDVSGKVSPQAVSEAVDFLYLVSRRQNVVVQAAILTSPEFWAAPEFMARFVERQILEWNTPVERDRLPRSQIYGSLRVVASSPHPDQPYVAAFPITLTSLQVATNVGRGGTLEKLLDEFVQEPYRHQIRPGLEAEVPKVMRAIAAFAARYEEEFRRQRGRCVGQDARGVSYAWPPYLMLDYLVSPVFSRPGRLVDVEPLYDEQGRRVGSAPILQDEGGRFRAEISGWSFIHLEPNVGVGLWDRFNLREEVLEAEASARQGRPFDWDNVGTSDRLVLCNFVLAGEQYLDAVRG